jgi:hypothetical protein
VPALRAGTASQRRPAPKGRWPPPQHGAAARRRRAAAQKISPTRIQKLFASSWYNSRKLSQAKESCALILPGLRPETEEIILSEVSQKSQKRESDGFAEIHQFLWS